MNYTTTKKTSLLPVLSLQWMLILLFWHSNNNQVSSFVVVPTTTPTSPSTTITRLSVSLVSTFIDPTNKNIKEDVSRMERQQLERAKQRVQHAQPQNKQDPSTTSTYQLESNRVSQLTIDSTAEDVMTAIKRAVNLRNVKDITTIQLFLSEGVDDSFAYGYKTSLLARLAVAALRLKQHDVATQVIAQRTNLSAGNYNSIIPMESAAIIRGLLRLSNVTDALQMLDEELSIPTEATQDIFYKERIKHRALSLASIASRHFFQKEPLTALMACRMLSDLGPTVQLTDLTENDLELPWTRIRMGAKECQQYFDQKSVFGTSQEETGNVGQDIPYCAPYELVVLHTMKSYATN